MGTVGQPQRYLPWLWEFPQVILDQSTGAFLSFTLNDESTKIYLDSLIFPVYAAGVSVAVLLLQLIFKSKPVRKLYARFSASEATLMDDSNAEELVVDIGETNEPESSAVGRHIAQLGGLTIFGFKFARFIALLALLGLQIFTAVSENQNPVDSELLRAPEWLQIGLCGVYGYASLLALVSVTAKLGLSRVVTRHLALILFVPWAVYVYRDVFPLMTFTLSPVDGADGALFWSKFAVLTFVAVVVPLLIPRQYIPIDPKNPAAEPNPEQTASILSMALFNFLDKPIIEAYRVPHLPLDKLPQLADYDQADQLVKKSRKHLDPFEVKKEKHLFFGLMSIFYKEYLVLVLMITIEDIAGFASPVAIERLLHYIETDGEDALVRPWVWILVLLFGPIVSSVALQYYIFNTTRMLVQVQGIITQLIFDHALRIRVKAEASETPAPSTVSTAVPTPDNASIIDASGSQDPHRSPTTSEEDSDTAHASTADASSTKGKQKPKLVSESGDSKKPVEKPAAGGSQGGNLVGKINNLVTTDLQNIINGRDFLYIVVEIPLNTALSVWFLYKILGWSAFVGMAVMVTMFPLPGYIASKIQSVQLDKMKKTDARVQNVTESMNMIRMIKLFGWEPRVTQQILDKREDELHFQKKAKLLELLNGNINYVIPLVTMVATFATYTVIMKESLTASRVFSSIAVFDLLRNQLHGIFNIIPGLIRAKVSLDRVDEFLHKSELLDEFTKKFEDIASELLLPKSEVDSGVIGFRNAAFTWSNDNDGLVTPGTPRTSKRNFTLRIEDELFFKRGHINLIVGPTGSGKTSLLMALLGELHYIPSSPDSFFNLPRAGGVAYAAQESWVQNETIRDNILFGAPFDEERYNKVIDQCGLERDLTLFDAGDKTEVGEKGLTLSGGQKARITLARAVYSSAEILLLDDVLAALDVHTARWIIDKCFRGDLVHGRTILLVTHNVAMASPIADFVVSLGTDGRVLSQGSLSKALAKNQKLSKEIVEDRQETEKADQEIDQPEMNPEAKKGDGKLIMEEEVSVGHIGWPAMKLFFASLAGGHQFLFWLCCLGGLLLSELISDVVHIWFLGYWARQYEDHDPSEVKVSFYLAVYSLLLVTAIVLYCVFYLVYVFGSLRASRSIHKTLVTSVLSTTLRWLDVTPTSRIIARCTQDIQAVDGQVSEYFSYVMELSGSMLLKLCAVVIMSPLFLAPGVIVFLFGGWCGQIYMKAQLSVKREMSNARSPVLGHFSAAIAGLTSIRAYSAQDAFRQESYARTDRYTRAARTFYNLNRWVCIRIETFGAVFSSGLAAYLVYGGALNASNTGFSLNMAVGFSGMILWWVRLVNEFEVSGNSLERIQQYILIEQEPKPTESGRPPAYWPASGDLKVEKLSARYSQDGPRVLQDISFEVKSGERVGIVGRTGSGKSSLTLSLLRCIVTEGKVYYDGMPTDSINLDALRSNITIIPQIPELLSGTLRQNLDPFQQHDDAVLNDALRAAGLFSLQNDSDEGRITLDSQISSGGGNLSVGQRQILALARAIVRQSKLLILDEATSAIDYATDTIIQTSLRRELSNDVTLLTVAHRLQTIMDSDKIMVLDAGRIVEFGPPSELLQKEKGLLRSLVDESGDKDALYAMAAGGSGSA